MALNHGGDIPFKIGEGGLDYRKLYRSKPEIALKIEVTLVPGLGVVKSGTMMGEIQSGTSQGKWAPYNPDPGTEWSAPDDDVGRAYLRLDSSTNDYVYIGINDSYMFSVGDVVAIDDISADAAEQLTISAIDRTTYERQDRAKITFSASISNDRAVSDYAHLYHDTEGSNTYSKAAGILEYTVDAGSDKNAQGALGIVILKNALLYRGMLINDDSDAQTDLSLTYQGNFALI